MVKTDIEVAHEAKLQPVQAVAEGLGLDLDDDGNVVGLF